MKEPAVSPENLSRRGFGKRLFGSALSFLFLESLFSGCSRANDAAVPELSRSVAEPVRPILKHWAVSLNEMCEDLKDEAIAPGVWQNRVEELFSRIELNELLEFIDFEKLSSDLEYPDLGVTTRSVVLPEMEGLPSKTVFVKKIFGMKKGRAIVPHGHSNMASAHLVLGGSFHLRHYDKVSKEEGHLVIEPSLEKTVVAGSASSISDDRDNVHWFIAQSDHAFTFDVIMLDTEGRKYDIHNLDIENAEKTGDGDRLRVPVIGVEAALKKYGKVHHGDGTG